MRLIVAFGIDTGDGGELPAGITAEDTAEAFAATLRTRFGGIDSPDPIKVDVLDVIAGVDLDAGERFAHATREANRQARTGPAAGEPNRAERRRRARAGTN